MKLENTSVPIRLGGGLRRPGPLRRATRIALLVLLVLSQPLWAATIVVDETACRLVDAIEAANTDTATGGCSAGSGADTIELTTDVTLTAPYTVNTGLPTVVSDITVEGGGFTLERSVGAPAFRFFSVATNGALTLVDVTLQNGASVVGGAIVANGPLNLIHSTVFGNSAALHGGGVHSSGTTALTLTGSLVTHNSAGQSGGGIYSSGSTLALTHSTVADNSAAVGGGIFHEQGDLSLTSSTVSENLANEACGGLQNAGTAVVTNSTLSGNSANDRGGGICNSGSATLNHCTLSGNSAGAGGGVYADGSTALTNTIVANSPSGGDCGGGADPIDNGHNFADDGSCGPGFNPITALDPELADNGGPTLTHALRPHSTARDAAGACGLAVDQRDAPRDDGACDSGSFEFQGVLCGNAQPDPGEECDDGNDVDGDGCDSNCTITRCGNGIVTDGEECDDGNEASCDGCDSECVVEEGSCGDGVLNPDCEECDDGNTSDGDGCAADCTIEVPDVPATGAVGTALLVLVVLGIGMYSIRRRATG